MGEYDAATQAEGLHTPGGRVTTTGIGGFTTGGGYGWTSSKYGLACDNLVSAEVVLADGSIVRASEDDNAELFWGIRGGGGNFGIVTEFEFRLEPLGPTVLAGLTAFPVERAPELVRRWRDWADAAPDELSTSCAVLTAPSAPFVPPELVGKPVFGVLVLYVGAPELGEDAIRPLREMGPPSTSSHRCPTPSSRRSSTRPVRRASATTGAASTCGTWTTRRSTSTSPTPSTWPGAGRR
ncbi:FAD-binding protein [Actinomadura madurae]|nr:FAD-binding protein [Actinomadura madurae]MCP9952376.1 FAD-binding protein [Actinomadura madurae]MCP9969144.1 FAD-binding protein [Actinomadura madurae]MCQ0006878.1 FAD-binding protein [Actinomadura madurae]